MKTLIDISKMTEKEASALKREITGYVQTHSIIKADGKLVILHSPWSKQDLLDILNKFKVAPMTEDGEEVTTVDPNLVQNVLTKLVDRGQRDLGERVQSILDSLPRTDRHYPSTGGKSEAVSVTAKNFILTVKHDKGETKIKTSGSDKKAAIDKVMKAERCPRSAILNVVEADAKVKSIIKHLQKVIDELDNSMTYPYAIAPKSFDRIKHLRENAKALLVDIHKENN